ncbi:MAG: hypothetical protein DRN66_00775 [Candidatus Nanohalarchaeota archaeon]|nr:MAG: hypothetical protein DRN66_00775 [Candidatus Nanohaloarchaeota archaeon]
MNKNKIVVFLIIAVVIAGSGCTGTAVNTATKGIAINSFTFSPTKMVNGEDGTLALEIQNIGGATAKNTKAFLYNIDSTAYFTITNSSNDNTTNHSFGDMSPPDTVNNIPSFPETVVWTLNNNGKVGAPEGIPITFDPKVRVCYLYNTTSTAEFTVISRDELRQQTQRGIYEEKPVVTRSSGGPLSIEIMTPQPIKAENGKKIKILVKVRNTDKLNGLVFQTPDNIDKCINPTEMKKLINRVNVSISIPDMPGGATLFDSQTVRLLKGDGEEGTATFTSKAVNLSNVVQKEFHIVMTTSYGYFVESQATFTLEHDGL